MATKAQIKTRALRRLRVLAAGETASTDIDDIIDAAYDATYAMLAEDGTVTWGSTDDVPDEAEYAFTTLVAAQCADEFGVPEDRYRRLQAEAWGPDGAGRKCAMRKLREYSAQQYAPMETEADYY